jgi:hypothetical protein
MDDRPLQKRRDGTLWVESQLDGSFEGNKHEVKPRGGTVGMFQIRQIMHIYASQSCSTKKEGA